MDVAAVMQRRVATVRAEDSLAHAAKRMRRLSCGSVVVLDDDRRPVALLTDRDICLHAEWTNRPLSDLRVSAAMSRHALVCRATDPVAHALDVLGLHQVRRLPVVDADGRLVGIVTIDDLARAAREHVDWLVPPVAAAGVGRALGEIGRPRLHDDPEATP